MSISSEDRIARLEGRLMALENIIAAMAVSAGEEELALPQLTIKQHACLQMLMRGASNAQIAERFNVSVNTAKVHVRSLFAKFGVHNRTSVVMRAKRAFNGLDDCDYIRLSGGLPKTWDADFEEPDRWAYLYRHEDDE